MLNVENYEPSDSHCITHWVIDEDYCWIKKHFDVVLSKLADGDGTRYGYYKNEKITFCMSKNEYLHCIATDGDNLTEQDRDSLMSWRLKELVEG